MYFDMGPPGLRGPGPMGFKDPRPRGPGNSGPMGPRTPPVCCLNHTVNKIIMPKAFLKYHEIAP